MSEVVLWRIGTDTPDYVAEDPTGKGAEITGGRWNQVGAPMLYTATSRALACLETVVHLDAGALPLNRYLVRITVTESAWNAATQVDPEMLAGWDAQPAGKVSLDWGTTWAAGKSTLLARVPSIVVPEEWNVLINPAHCDMTDVSTVKVRKWLYDARLLAPTSF